jgi:hypothetical protein
MQLAERVISAALATSLMFLTLGCATAEQLPLSPAEGSEPIPETTQKALPAVSLDNLNPEYVRQIAFDEVKQFLVSSPTGPDNINHVIDKGVNKEFVQQAIDKIPQMSGFFKDMGPIEKYTIIWTTNGGGPNLKELLCEEAGYCDVRDPEQFCSAGELQFVLVFCESDPKNIDMYIYPIWHGYTHFQQIAVSGNTPQHYWFSEGTASFFGPHFAGFHFEKTEYGTDWNSLSYLRDLLYNNQSIVKFDSPATKKNIIDALIATTDFNGRYDGWQQAQIGYYLGFIAVEALIAAEGFETFKSYWRLTAEKGFEAAFEEVYGLTEREFFKKLAPYAVEMMERDRFGTF